MTLQSSRVEHWRTALGITLTHYPTSFADLFLQYPIPPRDMEETDIGDVATTDLTTIHSSNTNPTEKESSLDPLTAMYMQDVQEQRTWQTRQLRYQTTKQKKKRTSQQQQYAHEEEEEEETWTRKEQRAVSWHILQKDLHRLPDPSTTSSADGLLAHRKTMIAQVLFVWLCHTNTEYQQGMHEVVSYLLYALEVDVAVGATKRSTMSPTTMTFGGDGYFAQTLWELVSVVLPALLPAYQTSLQPMTQRILRTLQQYQPAIHQRIQQLPMQLVFCKWIRLLFAREVCDVLTLWDALFPYHSCPNNANGEEVTSTSTTTTLLQACEALCVARLLLHRDWILDTSTNTTISPQQQHHHHYHYHSTDDLLHWLMNLAPEESLDIWIPLFTRIVQKASVDDLLPPRVVVPANTTTTASWTDPLSQAFSQLTMTPARVPSYSDHNTSTTAHNHTNNNNNNAFSAFKERWVQPSEQLWTQKIHSVSQRLFATTTTTNHHQRQEEPIERDYSDPDGVMTPYHRTKTAHPPRDYATAAHHMQQALNTMAAYLMEQPNVPLHVQQAMAELQVIQQDLSRRHYE